MLDGKITSNELWANLYALMILCLDNDTDNCDLTMPACELYTKPINVHIEFSVAEDEEAEV